MIGTEDLKQFVSVAFRLQMQMLLIYIEYMQIEYTEVEQKAIPLLGTGTVQCDICITLTGFFSYHVSTAAEEG